MAGTHRIFDHVLFAALLVIPIIEWRWMWPRFLARLASREARIRLRFYRAAILQTWLLTLCLLVFWIAQGRPWSRLLLGHPPFLRLAGGLAVAVLLAGFLRWQRERTLAHPEAIERARRALACAAPLLPHTRAERKVFWIVSATAGICEEVLFRGFLIWYLAVWIGPIAAIVLSSLIFGAGHIYLGLAQTPRAALAGLIFACLAFASASLWPAILLHAALDWNSGELWFCTQGAARPKGPSKEIHG